MSTVFSILTISSFLTAVLSSVLPRADISYGKCKNPTISYNDNMGYFPANRAQFDHEPTQEIAPIYNFICSHLANKCAAPDITVDYCKIAIKQAEKAGWSKAARATAFNNYILHLKSINDPMPNTTPTAKPKPKPKPKPTPSPLPKKGLNISAVFSVEAVEFDGWVDPVWWINEKMVETKGTPSQCQPKPNGHQMPGGHYLIPECEGHDPNSIPIMRKALIEIISATIKNDSLKDEERIFKYGTHPQRNCGAGRRTRRDSPQPFLSNVTLPLNRTNLPDIEPDELEWTPEDENRKAYCYTTYRKYTRWPMEMKLIIGDYAGGKGFSQGRFHYTITKPTANACKLCSFFAAGGAGSSAVGTATTNTGIFANKLLGPGIGFAGAVLTFECLFKCGK